MVALKETTMAGRQILAREFGLLARLRHPHLARVHDWFEASPVSPDRAAYTQELVGGTDLFRALKSQPIEVHEEAFDQILRALAYLHALDVLHLDLKPDNVFVELLDGRPLVRVLDFGIAHHGDGAITHVGGSYSYVAPEVVVGGEITAAADLYALGVMMCEVATGRPPDPIALKEELADYDARVAWLAAGGCPPSWQDTVAALLDQDSTKRPRSAHEAARLWARHRRREVALFLPDDVAAMVRAGAPAERQSELDACEAVWRDGGGLVLVGPVGAGKASVLRAAERQAQVAGRWTESWPASESSATPRSFAAAITRLTGASSILTTLSETADGLTERGAGAPSADASARFAAWMRERAVRVVELLTDVEPRDPTPVLVLPDLGRCPRIVRAIVDAALDHLNAGGALPFALLVGAEEHASALSVQAPPLGRSDVRRFLGRCFGIGAADARLSASLAAASGGLPVHLAQLTALAVAQGHLAFDGARWRTREQGAELTLPADVADVLSARVALLDVPAREALAALSWLRFPSHGDAIGATLASQEPPTQALLSLEAAGLIWHETDRYQLSHPGLNAAFNGWEPAGGADAGHARVRALAGLDDVARAWHAGGAAGAEALYTMASAAWEQGDVEVAAARLDLALELAPKRLDALIMRAEVADLLGPRERQIRSLREALSQLDPTDERHLELESRLFWALTRAGQDDEAEPIGRALIEHAEKRGRTRLLAEALGHLSIVLSHRGAYDDAEACLKRAITTAAPLGVLGLSARLHNNLGNVFAYREDPTSALVEYSEANRLKTEEGDPVGQRIAVGNMGLMCMRLGRHAEAMAHFAASYAAARETQHRRGIAWSLCALANIGLEAGAWAYSLRRSEAALAAASALGDAMIAADATITKSEAELGLGDVSAARASLEGAVSAGATSYSSSRSSVARAATSLAVGDMDAALKWADEATNDTSVDAFGRIEAMRIRAAILRQQGDVAGAVEACHQALAAAEEGRSPSMWNTVIDVARAVGDQALLRRSVAQARRDVAEWAGRWPEAPVSDGVEPGSAVDAPSRASFNAMASVIALREILEQHADTEGEPMSDSVEAGEAQVRRGTATFARPALVASIGGVLADLVPAFGAERAFLVDGSGSVVCARDADGESVSDAAKKVPMVAHEQARERGAIWTGAGGKGRGSIAGIPVQLRVGGDLVVCVLVLQNRFAAEAFEHLFDAQVELGALPILLRIWCLEARLAHVQRDAERAEAERQAVVTRSTEEILVLRRELETTREKIGPTNAYPEIVFASPQMRKMLRQVDRVVDTDLSVHVQGESGTGKELVARAIHDHGDRKLGPFVAQNCSAVPHTLFESEFFGHERGAFTGANRASEGLFRRAHRGTLFLDEIGDLPLELQSKLLRVLETGEVRPVGGQRSFSVDVRIVSATHHDLSELVREGRFREDLFYRLNVVKISVPPLRERPDDITVLAEHFLKLRAASVGRTVAFGKGVMKALIAYSWPGNVRQLENEVTRAALLCDGDIDVSDLSPEVASARRGTIAQRADGAELKRLGLDRGTLRERVDRLEAFVLRSTLASARGNKSAVARDLGLSRAGLNMKLKRLELWED